MFLQSLLFAKDKSYFEKNPRNFVEEFWENRETDATQGYKDLKKNSEEIIAGFPRRNSEADHS